MIEAAYALNLKYGRQTAVLTCLQVLCIIEARMTLLRNRQGYKQFIKSNSKKLYWGIQRDICEFRERIDAIRRHFPYHE